MHMLFACWWASHSRECCKVQAFHFLCCLHSYWSKNAQPCCPTDSWKASSCSRCCKGDCKTCDICGLICGWKNGFFIIRVVVASRTRVSAINMHHFLVTLLSIGMIDVVMAMIHVLAMFFLITAIIIMAGTTIIMAVWMVMVVTVTLIIAMVVIAGTIMAVVTLLHWYHSNDLQRNEV